MKPFGESCCVVCGRTIDEAPVTLRSKSEPHPERAYEFFVHPACLKQVAKPGFVGLDQL